MLIPALTLQGALLVVLFILQFVLPPYHISSFSKIMILACYGIGYNILLGYTGLMSLGHAMFFATGMYASGLAVLNLHVGPASALLIGTGVTFAAALLFGLFAL